MNLPAEGVYGPGYPFRHETAVEKTPSPGLLLPSQSPHLPVFFDVPDALDFEFL